ncbi:MAG: hypothetical protein WCI73_18245, partial [Phycisphaerae bacterium]
CPGTFVTSALPTAETTPTHTSAMHEVLKYILPVDNIARKFSKDSSKLILFLIHQHGEKVLLRPDYEA